MTVQVAPVERRQGLLESAIPSIAGKALGGIGEEVGSSLFDSKGGKAIGSAVGGSVGQGVGSSVGEAAVKTPVTPTPVQASAVDRRLNLVQQDPLSIMQQGKAALAQMDPATRKAYEPMINDGLKRAYQQKGT